MSSPSRERKRHGGGIRKPRNGRKSTLEFVDELFATKIAKTAGEASMDLTALEAIVLQLLRKSMAGDKRAANVLLRYQRADPEQIEPRIVVIGGLPNRS